MSWFKVPVCVILLFLSTLPALADPTADFTAGIEAMEAKEYERALTLFDKVLREEPVSNALWNAGMCAFHLGDGAKAAAYWEQLKKVDPRDWHVRSKLVQAYQMQGKLKQVEAEREELLALQKKEPELFPRPHFCREQFKVGGRQLMAFELFEMTPPRGLKYIFYVLTDDGRQDYRISLGSYDDTNTIAHEVGTVPEGVRLFHLDGYYDGGARHLTFGFYQGEPSYAEVREAVVQILEGKKKAVSGTTRGT